MNRRTIFRWAIGGGLAAVLLLGMVLASGLISPIGRLQDLVGYGGAHSDAPEQGRHLFHTGADIGGEKEGMTYARFDASRDTNAARSFFGFAAWRPARGMKLATDGQSDMMSGRLLTASASAGARSKAAQPMR